MLQMAEKEASCLGELERLEEEMESLLTVGRKYRYLSARVCREALNRP